MTRATADLLDEADRHYAAGDAGLRALDWRSAFAVRTAREVYSAIGTQIRRQACDPLAGRAWVSRSAKLRLLLRALAEELGEAPIRLTSSHGPLPPPTRVARFPADVLSA
jgi:phytoene synthase